MKRLNQNILIFTLLLIFPNTASLQETMQMDSLKRLIANSSDDFVKVELLQKLFWEYRRIDPEKAMVYAQKSLDLAKSINYMQGIGSSLHLTGIIKKAQGKYGESIKLLDSALFYYQSLNDTIGMVSCYTDLGDINNRQSYYEKALYFLDEARKLVLQTNNREKLSRIYSMLGGIYNSQNQYNKALEYHKKSLEINESLDFKLGLSVNYNNIGNVYLDLKKLNKAKEYYSKSLEIKYDINDAIGIASTLNNLGLISSEAGDYTLAIDYHNRALSKYTELNDNSGISMCYINLANDYLGLKQPQKAIDFAEKGLNIFEDQQHKKVQAEAYRILSEAYAALNSFENAFNYQKLYKIYNDSIQNLEVVRQITEMETKFETEKKEKEIAVLNAEKEKQELKMQKQRSQRNLMIGLTAFVLVLLAILIWNFRNKQRLNKKLKELNLIKSRFFANISHEFRTPLTLLLGPLEKLLENPKQEEKDMIKIMHRNATRLLMLDNQLLDLSRLESGKLKLEVLKADISSALKGMVMSFHSLANKRNIHFQVRFPDKEILAFFDLDKLEKIIYNLLSNAMKFTPEGGAVTFELSLIEDKKQYPVKMKKTQGHIIRISVTDTGPGIDEEHASLIFDRFYQVDTKMNRKFEGTGLGLSISKELAELHHGLLTLKSSRSKGSVFNVFLPLEKKAYKQNELLEGVKKNGFATAPLEAKLTIDNEKKTEPSSVDHEFFAERDETFQILIVEDNHDMRHYIRDCFDNDYNIIEAENGKEGMEEARKNIPDLIISDLMMPEMNGIELCKNLKTELSTSHIPIILLTALASVEDKIKGLKTGADDYIAKPFNREELQTRVQNLIDQRKKLIDQFSASIKLEAKEITITSTDEKFIEKLILTIEHNLSNPDLNVDILVEEIHLSRSQLHRKLKALTGMSATELIRNIRLKRAAQLLEQRFGTIAETVYAVGFNSLSYFSKCFQKQFNMTPKEYIDQCDLS